MIRLNRNESALTHAESVLNLPLQSKDLRQYDDDEITEQLKFALSRYTFLPTTHLMLAGGSTNFLRAVVNIYVHGPQDEVVTIWPTYIDFVKLVRFQNGTLKMHRISPQDQVNLRDGGKHRLIEYLITMNTRLVYLCSPNNPIDFVWDENEVSYLCEKYPDVVFLIDQAYYEFQEFGNLVMSWAGTKYENLLVTRTFSKAFGLAGGRLGYMGGAPHILEQCRDRYVVNREIPAYTKRLALQIMQHELVHYQKELSKTKEIRNRTSKELQSLGFMNHNSDTNFLLVQVADPDGITKFLNDHQILVRNVSQPPYEIHGCIRISIGSEEDMQTLISILSKYLKLTYKSKSV